ncbi:hypothetical protein Srot_2016 [Segniliparus rotundus DSM 44985]|uniref:PknH-like extracellular domain-containing protein n=1 Tax=Segniliparus rotundus (strain ATCC BAA-972 / CDC 1076 / CIP 108378 / DSM 44985 / JCM 13578) TaxID=640132 RepID=D6Z942_SEGRD|nr:sensor domain-containing protein [Segniliparus rotundus]ADG98472.1 hypothetical protein Srot_2016 [Segniliparus rotundus DSM 44985]
MRLGAFGRLKKFPGGPAALGLCVASAVFTGMGLGSWAGVVVVPGHAAPDGRLLPLAVPDATRLVPASALESIAVPADQAAGLVNAPLAWSRDVTAPGADSKTTANQCLLADPVGTRAAYGEEWTAFRKTTVQPAEDDDSTQIVMSVGLYPSESKPRGRYVSLVSELRACDGVSATETDAIGAEFPLTFHVEPSDEEHSIRWRSEKAGAPARSCSYDARVRRNVFLEVMVCAADPQGEGAEPVADALEEALPA